MRFITVKKRYHGETTFWAGDIVEVQPLHVGTYDDRQGWSDGRNMATRISPRTSILLKTRSESISADIDYDEFLEKIGALRLNKEKK